METVVYFVRHARADNTVEDTRNRPLTEKGMNSVKFVTAYLSDKGIDSVYSSPYKRAVDTVQDFAERMGLQVSVDERLIEHCRENRDGIDVKLEYKDYLPIARSLWDLFSYRYKGGESIAELQARNVAALTDILEKNAGKNVVIGTHGFALASVLNYYDSGFRYTEFLWMLEKCPWIVKMIFDESFRRVSVEMVDVISIPGEFFVSLNSIQDVKRFVLCACTAPVDIELTSGRFTVDAKSIMGVFSLDLSRPVRVNVIGSESAASEFRDTISEFLDIEN